MGQRQSEIIKNHMEVYWHDYASASKGVPITEAGLVEKASVIGRTGLMLLECGTGAWRVRSSMNTLSRELGVTTTADIGLLSIEFTCFDGDQCYTQSLCLTNTGVNTSRLNRLEHFVNDFDREGKFMTGEELHSHLDEIERIHGLYSPIALGFAVNHFFHAFTQNAVRVLPLISTTAIVLIICAVVSANSAKIMTSGLLILAVVILHNLLGYLTGFGVGKLLKLDSTKCRAISIEVGMQNSGLATSLAAAHFAQYPLATIPGAVFSVWHNISGALLANFFARTAEKKD